VICLRNDRALDVVNGTQGTVRSITDHEITLTTDQGRRQLPFGYVIDGHLDHGYATTIHKTQGLTVDRAFVLATDSLTREAGYVAMSRARKGTDLFVPISAFEDGIPPDQKELTNPMHGVEKRFLVSRAKGLASNDLPEPFGTSRTPPVDTRVAIEPVASEPASSEPSPSVDRPSAGRPSIDQPADRYLVPMLGRRPAFLAERPAYDQVARSVTTYRTRYGVEGERALGAPPLEAFQRSDYERVLTEVRTYQRRLGLSLEIEGPGRGMSR
jgi:hypothetical protein